MASSAAPVWASLLSPNRSTIASLLYYFHSSCSQGIQAFFGVSLPAALLNSSRKYIHSLLTLQIRMRLSKVVNDEYLSGVNFYKTVNLAGLSTVLGDTDQRGTESGWGGGGKDGRVHFCHDLHPG